MLKVQDLHVFVGTQEILKGLSLEINPGETHAIMGPNGSGKSTLAQALMGHPSYSKITGSITFGGENLLEMDPAERAHAGLFLSFQHPLEIPGVNISSFLRMIYNKSHETALSPVAFRKYVAEKLEILEIQPEFLHRSLNEGFSGGEKKRLEMLQMLVLEPKLVILDEVDSGLDVDALKVVAHAVNYLQKTQETSFLAITHYARILHYLNPEFVHILVAGKIVKTGGFDLATQIETQGYNPALINSDAQ